ncbi:MAG TPA: restriction endonuclease, partial [Gallicola sp.]|nr:restriction endonuclease [Gallicola sp.]
MRKKFDEWLSTFKDSIAGWDYYTDFEKAYINVDKIKIELSILNSLIGEKDIENKFRSIIKTYPNVLTAIPILLAKREHELSINDAKGTINYRFSGKINSEDEYVLLMHKMGLFDLISNHIISNLIDYVTGVEVGLDSNARKNRTGTSMENIVEYFIKEIMNENVT